MKKLLRLLKEPFVWFFVFPVIGFLLWSGMNYTGFCWAEKRWLSDQERIDIAIKSIVSQKTAWIPVENGETHEYEVVPYKSVDEFKQKNPDCCKMLNFSHDLSDVIWGNLSNKVPKIVYKILYIKNDENVLFKPNPNNTEWGFYFQNQCGKPYDIFQYRAF